MRSLEKWFVLALVLGVALAPLSGAWAGRDRGFNQPGVAGNVHGVARRTTRRVAVGTTAAVTTTAAVAATAAVATPAVGSVVTVLPGGCVTTTEGGVEYYLCGGVRYRAAFQGNNLVYVVE